MRLSRNLISLVVLVLMAVVGTSQTLPLRRANLSPLAAASAEAVEKPRPDYFWRSPDRIYEEQWFKRNDEEEKQYYIIKDTIYQIDELENAESAEEKRRLLEALNLEVLNGRWDYVYQLARVLNAIKEHPDLILFALDKKIPDEIGVHPELAQFFSGTVYDPVRRTSVSVAIPLAVISRLAEKLSIRRADEGVALWRELKRRRDISQKDRLRIWQILLSKAATPGIKFVMELASMAGDIEAQKRHIRRYAGTLNTDEFKIALKLFLVPERIEWRRPDGSGEIIGDIWVLVDREVAEMLLERTPILEAAEIAVWLTDENEEIFSRYPEFRRLMMEKVSEIKDQLTAENYIRALVKHDDLWRIFLKKARNVRFSGIQYYDSMLSELGEKATPQEKERLRRFFAEHADSETLFVFSLRAFQTNEKALMKLINGYQGRVEEKDNIIEAISAVRRYPKALDLLDKKLGIVAYGQVSNEQCSFIYDSLPNDSRRLLWTTKEERRIGSAGTPLTFYKDIPAPNVFDVFSLWLRHISFYNKQQWAGTDYISWRGLDIGGTLCMLYEINRDPAVKKRFMPAVLGLTDPEEKIMFFETVPAFEKIAPNNSLMRGFLEKHMSEEVRIVRRYRNLRTLKERKSFLRDLITQNYRFRYNNDALVPKFDAVSGFDYEIDGELVRLLLSLLDRYSINEFSRDLALYLNTLHDLGKLREQEAIAAALPASAWYYIISQGQEVYTSTFQLLYGKLVRYLESEGITLRQFVSQVDPKRDFISGFILTMSYFDRLGDLMRSDEDADYWADLFMGLLFGSYYSYDYYDYDYEVSQNGFFLMPTLEKIFAKGDTAMRMRFERALLKLYEDTPKTRKTQITRRMLEIIFWKLRDRFSPEMRRKVGPAIQHLNEFYRRQAEIPYAGWTKKTNTLTIFSNWHPQETGHMANFIAMAQSRGYRTVSKRTIPEEDTRSGEAETEIILEKDIDISTSPFRKVRLINRLSSLPDIKKVMEDATIQIIAHRGHSYQLMDTFNDSATPPLVKMLFIGSCGGFRSIPELAKQYGGKNLQFLASLDVTEGAINNPLFLYVVEQIAGGRAKQWQDIKANLPLFLKDKEKARAFVWPGELPMLLLFSQSN